MHAFSLTPEGSDTLEGTLGLLGCHGQSPLVHVGCLQGTVNRVLVVGGW